MIDKIKGLRLSKQDLDILIFLCDMATYEIAMFMICSLNK